MFDNEKVGTSNKKLIFVKSLNIVFKFIYCELKSLFLMKNNKNSGLPKKWMLYSHCVLSNPKRIMYNFR